ncbi:N-acetylmuramoyl-L-alanine amidase [Cytobacillus gottheilii]|uniref:N-acetylmuramoyl-L-alanine amidase n=1 Tax=Cytobacillus gottheilii TaxID=859144 RepID=A0ABX8FA75_9BACI|nr:N-acetylmuramoyl-L-alanine amidase [Cytobacillus gottheilii]QVY60427.1 N-acetylmuramoyl-L-alanine amidase [Cytobacillus gottheilii]
MVKIFIDPGHGGSDPGAVGNGLQEKDLTLQIAIRIRDILGSEYENVELNMSRTGDTALSLSSRTNAANAWGADFLLSIHINAGGGTGYEDFIYPNVGAPTATYQNIIHEEVIKAVDFADRGKKQANFHMLRESAMPALLTENGFIDHANDAAKLAQPAFIEGIARGHVNGLARAFGLKKKQINLFRVQIGAFRDKGNADSLAAQARSAGFDSFVLAENGLYKVQAGAFSDRKNAEQLVQHLTAAGFEAIIL